MLFHPNSYYLNYLFQNNGVDCGVFAIAFATAICNNINPVEWNYDCVKMRRHLELCIRAGKLSPFPTTSQRKISKRLQVITSEKVSIYCICRTNDFGDTMVQCHQCAQYYHANCVGFLHEKEAARKIDFVCEQCLLV